MGSQTDKPFITIGITTYHRPQLLREAVLSILNQNFPDCEILIGNDYTSEKITADSIGFQDSRIKIFNHPVNLGETDNLNFLLEKADGTYFTWLADDDLHVSNYLKRMFQVISGQPKKPEVAFCSYKMVHGLENPNLDPSPPGKVHRMDGRVFLSKYLSAELRLIGVYGTFDTHKLRLMGGIPSFTDVKIGLYGEYGLLLNCGRLTEILYIEDELVQYRFHSDVFTPKQDLSQFELASKKFIRKGFDTLSCHNLGKNFLSNFLALLRLCSTQRIYRTRYLDHALIDWKVMSMFLTNLKKEVLDVASKGSGLISFWVVLGIGLEKCRILILIFKERIRSLSYPVFWDSLSRMKRFFFHGKNRNFWE